MSDKKPGRVYGMDRNKPGERFGGGYRFFTHTGVKLPFLQRVEFDADADEGMATVTAVYCAGGAPLVDHERAEVCAVTFRTWLRAVPREAPAPALTPDAVLWKQADGSIKWYETDPLPDEAVEAITEATAALAAAN